MPERYFVTSWLKKGIPMATIDASIIRAIEFAAQRHNGQFRKGTRKSPYINHPIKVVSLLIQHHEYNTDLLTAAALHDVIEDTAKTDAEKKKLATAIEKTFGNRTLSIVREVSDDKSLPFQERKQLQVTNTPFLSPEAKKIKIADKICNLEDILEDPPEKWSNDRKKGYLEWAGRVVEGARGVNEELEQRFAKIRQTLMKTLKR
jgi:guanosine-3',5'-bis(diphosphate) 3'-pyrophosphohydrolase